MSLSSAAVRQSTPLPAILTPVLGRTAELDQAMRLIDDPATRLVTLTGPAGVGKTRLAQFVAATLVDEFDRDVVYVPLASIRDPDLVLPAIGQALGVPADASDAWDDRLAQAIAQRSALLLVLDNFEQLLDAAPAIAALLGRCRDATILVTSQAALGIAGEQLAPPPPPANASDRRDDGGRDPALRCGRPLHRPRSRRPPQPRRR